MAEDTSKVTEDTTDADESSAGDGATEDEKDWQSEFEAQKRINRNLERKGKNDLARISQLETDLAALREGAGKKDEGTPVDADKIRDEARAEAQAEALTGRVLDKIEAKAARDFEHPEDVSAFLAGRAKDFASGNEIDLEAIDDALADLKAKRPGWLLQTDDCRFKGGADGGARKVPDPKSIPEQIAEAEAAGEWAKARQLKVRQLTEQQN